MNAYKFLDSLQDLETDLKNKIAELHRLEMLETDISAPLKPDKVQSSGSKDKLGSLIANRIDYERDEVQKAEAAFLQRLDEVVNILEKVKTVNFQEYNTLYLRYVQYIELVDIAGITNYSYSRIKVFHRKGIEKVQKILDFEKDSPKKC